MTMSRNVIDAIATHAAEAFWGVLLFLGSTAQLQKMVWVGNSVFPSTYQWILTALREAEAH